MMLDNQMMTLKEWDWDRGVHVEVEYPVEIVAEFVNKMRLQKQWRESPDPGRSVWDMFHRFQSRLMDYRNVHPAQQETEVTEEREPGALQPARDLVGA